MRLEDLAAEIRPRGNWEAVDLGFALARRHFPRLLLLWCLTVLPLWALILAATPWIGIGWATFIIWWLKPLTERVPLFHVSRAMFGAAPRIRDVLREWPRMLTRGLWRALVTSRIGLQRALLLPVTMLEGLAGKDRRQRERVLSTHSGGTASSLMVVCVLFEPLLTFGLLTVLLNFIPDSTSEDFLDHLFTLGEFGNLEGWLLWTSTACWLVALTFIGIFYTSGCFGLYLNCRTQTEGWDVEITFRRLARRLTKAVAILALLCASANAAEVERGRDTRTPEMSEKHDAIGRVLADKDFTIHKEKYKVSKSTSIGGGGSWSLFSGLEGLGVFLFWAVVIVLLSLLAWWLVNHWHTLNLSRGRGRAREKIEPSGPRTIMGLDVAPDSLPADILATARELWRAGDAHAALSLLYRGALGWFIGVAAVPLSDSDTEGDCLRLVAENDAHAGEARYFSELTQHWIHAAYASRAPRAEEMDTLLGAWPFAGRARA